MIGHSFDFYERSLCTTTTRSLPAPHRLACHAKKRVWSLSFPTHARPKRVFTTRPTRIYRFGRFSLKPRVKKKYLGWHSPKIFFRSLLTWHPADGADTCKSDAMWSLYWPQPNKQSAPFSLPLLLSRRVSLWISHRFSFILLRIPRRFKRNDRKSPAKYSVAVPWAPGHGRLCERVDSDELGLVRHHSWHFQRTFTPLWKCKNGKFRNI